MTCANERGKRVNIMAKTNVKENNTVETNVQKKAAPKANKAKSMEFLTQFVETANAEGSPLKPEKSLMERISYTMKNAAKATATDLIDLVNEARAVLEAAVAPVPAPVEASTKPKLGKPKTDGKSAKKGAVETVPPVTTKGADKYPLAAMFPKTIEHPDLGTLVAADGMFTTWDELMTALSEDKTIYFAAYWTKRQIKEFRYSEVLAVKVPKDGFPNDLDILQAAIPCENIHRLWCMSVYTEALFRFEEDHLAYEEEVDPRGDGKSMFRVRVSAGMEYEIYVPEDEMEVPEAKSKTKGKK